MTHDIGRARPQEYEALFQQKRDEIKQQFDRFNPATFEAFQSSPSHFRMRAEFKIWHNENGANYAMHKPGEYKQPVIVDTFDIGSETICALMPKLLDAINASDTLKRKLFQIEFLTSKADDAVVTLIYHRPLDSEWETHAQQLESTFSIHIIGRSRKQKCVLSKDYIIESFTVANERFEYQQVETGFTQPNAEMCERMLNWASAKTQHLGGDLLELYCGNGNFTLPLSRNFNKVLATEISKTSVNSALFNIQKNKINNIEIARMSSEEFTSAMNKEREYHRLKNIDLDSYQFSSVFVDPPRAGLDNETVEMISAYDNILYISCNPETLEQNLTALTLTHELKDFAFFDQFPYTHHCECGALLTKKAKG